MCSPVAANLDVKSDGSKIPSRVEMGKEKRPEDYESLAKICFENSICDHSVQHSLHRESGSSNLEANLKKRLSIAKEALCYNQELQTQLWNASKFHDLSLWKEEIDRALSQGADINICDEQGSYLINYFSDDPQRVNFLLCKGTDPFLHNGRGNNLFFNIDRIAVLTVVFSHNANCIKEILSLRDTQGDTVFTAYIKKKLSTITREEIEFFLSKGFEIHAPIPTPEYIESIVHYLARTKGGHSALCMIYSKGAEKFLDSRNQTALDLAIQHDQWDSACSLIRYGSLITPENFKSICNQFPLDEPLTKDFHFLLAKAVLNSPALNFPKYHWSRAHFAARCNIWTATIKPDNPNSIQDPLLQTPLHIAAYYGNFASVYCLLEAGADPNIESKRGKPSSLSGLAGIPKPVDDLLMIYRTIREKEERATKTVQLCEKYSKDQQDDYSIVKNIAHSP